MTLPGIYDSVLLLFRYHGVSVSDLTTSVFVVSAASVVLSSPRSSPAGTVVGLKTEDRGYWHSLVYG